METCVCRVRDTEKASPGSGLFSGKDSPLVWDVGVGVRTDLLNSLGRGWNRDVWLSDSSLAGGVSGGVGDCEVGCGDMIILRIRDTAIVASAAISVTKDGDPVFVTNTTKYGIKLQRENLRGRGSVTCDGIHQSRFLKSSHIYTHSTAERNWTFGNQWQLQPRFRFDGRTVNGSEISVRME